MAVNLLSITLQIPMFELLIGSKRFSDISDFEQSQPDLPELALEAISFCKNWLSGQKIFEIQTSGSTGSPKIITINRDQMLASALATQRYFKVKSSTSMLLCMNPRFIAGKMMLVRAMVWDCPILWVEPSSNPFGSIPENFHPKFIAMVPLQVEETVKTHMDQLKTVEYLLIGGASVSSHLKNTLVSNQIKAYQTYGMTETVSHIAIAPYEEGDLVYESLPGVNLGQDSRDTLWVKSEMSGNHKIQTNDLVKFIEENRFYWLGRVDFVINSGGIKLHPELLETKIESIVKTYFPDSHFFLGGLPDERLGNKLILFIESDHNLIEKAKELHDQLQVNLGKYESPKEILLLPEFVKTDSGKVNRIKTIELSQ
ncbi:AMP-binding protein [Algoriphagus aestuarii]|nr:AMP-binding protein [Algoriphagus aestuarii]